MIFWANEIIEDPTFKLKYETIFMMRDVDPNMNE
jgi:hypothetical protein